MENRIVLAAFLVTLMISAVADNFNSMEDRMDSQQDYAEDLNDRTDQGMESVEGTLASHEAAMDSLEAKDGELEAKDGELEADLEAEAESLEDRDDELSARDNELAAGADQMQGMVTMHSQALQGLSEDVTLLMDGPQWVNDVGASGGSWTLTLNDSQWLEVKSATYIRVQSEGRMHGPHSLEVMEEGGSGMNNGYSPIFGGSYALCYQGQVTTTGIECNLESDDPNNWAMGQWSVIYRIHDV